MVLTVPGCGRRPAQPVTLTLVGFGMDAGAQLKRDALDDFTRAKGIRVDLVPAWGTSSEQLSQTSRLLSLRANQPDVYVIDVIWPGTLAAGLLDLTPYTNQDARAHLPALLENDTVGGRLVSLPLYVNVGMLYYRTDLLKKYGYHQPPATWDELESMATNIQRGQRAAGNPAFWGYVWQGGAYEGLTCDALEWQGSFGGGRIIETDGTISVNNPQAVQALRKAEHWVGSISPMGVLSYTESDSLEVFRAGNAAFLRHWSGALAASRSGNTPIRGRFNVTLLPAGPHGRAQAMGGFHLAVSRHSAQPRESAQLVQYLTGSEVQLRRAVSAGYLPTIPRLYRNLDLLKVLPIAAALQSAGEHAWVARPSTVAGSRYGAVSKAYYQAVHDVLSRRTDPAEALSQLEKTLVGLTGFRTGAPRN
ncbi:MAG TPA: ABC transporter substrate-binding protein [Candidatus Acidoferrales bacterium]|nr:ABC transporter substrate-binding protein [Candidatus Acidoferrales bacterium]